MVASPRGGARRILDAASRLLRDRRFRDLTVDAVMAEAGLSRTVFYRHFESLGDLVIPLLEELGATLEDAGDHHEVDYVNRVLTRVVAIAVEHGPLLRAIDEAASHDDEVERAYREFVAGASTPRPLSSRSRSAAARCARSPTRARSRTR